MDVWQDIKIPLEPGGSVRRTPGDRIKNRKPQKRGFIMLY